MYIYIWIGKYISKGDKFDNINMYYASHAELSNAYYKN